MRTVLTGLGLLAALTAAPTATAQYFAFMPYVGYHADLEAPLVGVGARFRVPLASPALNLALQPAVEVTLDNGSNVQVDVNAIAEFGGGPVVSPFVGGGLAVVIPEVGDTNVGGNVLGGLVFNAGFVKPFAQARYTFADNSYFAAHLGVVLDI